MRKMIKHISVFLAAALVMGMSGCAEKADATVAIAMGMFACTVRMDLAAGQSVQTTEEVNEDDEYVPTMSLEEALERMEYAKTDHFLVFEKEEGATLFYYASLQESAEDFTGTWKRTDVKAVWSATIKISNQDENGFDVDGNFQFQSQKGIIEGRAYFVTENMAILRVHNVRAEQEEENGETECYEYVAFERTETGLDIYATARGDDLFGTLVNYCFAEGNYVQGEPFYTDANILHDTYTDAQLEEIKILVGDELYEDCFVETTENGSIHIYDIVLEDGTYGKKYHAYSIGREASLFYKIYIFENGDIYGIIGKDRIFFTNVEGATEVPDYDITERHMTYEEFKTYLKETAPNMQAGEVISLPTTLDYYFVIGTAVYNHNGEAVNSVYVLKHPAGKLFLLICYDSMSHDFVTRVYDITGDEFVQCSMLSLAEVTEDVISIDQITISHTLNVLGTYWCDKEYALDENGMLVAYTEGYSFEPPEDEIWELILIKELPVVMNGVSTTIASGEKIKIIGTDGKSEIYFRVISTGENGIIYYERTEGEYGPGPYMINGISEMEYFKWIPYTG